MIDWSCLLNPFDFKNYLWPHAKFYDKQVQIVNSVWYEAHKTIVPAGNKLGKDYIGGFLALWAFLTGGGHGFKTESRVITTSVKDDHLRVMWGEIGRWIQSCREPLEYPKGPLIINHRDIKKVVNGKECKISYLRGMVSETGEGLAGHHADYTLLIVDEASGVANQVFTQGDTWAKRMLIIGNPNPTENYFKKWVKAGDVRIEDEYEGQ